MMANIAIYALIIIFLALFHRELIWAQKTLRGYLFTGQLDPPASNLLMLEALKYPRKDREAERHFQLLEKAYQIEPYSLVLLMLGDFHAEQGQDDLALDLYNRFRSMDPSYADVYFKMADILERKGDQGAVYQLLEEGIEHFKKRVVLYQPHYDPSVAQEFNIKAAKLYSMSKEGLKRLERIKEELKDSEQFKDSQK